MGTPIVEFDRVCKSFRLGSGHDSLRDVLADMWSRLTSRHPSMRRDFTALSEVSFAVDRGEACGVIGPNGAGKSTALKLLAGILRADAGRVAVRGRLAALIEVGAGFHGDLTGRENVYLNGAILGMSRRDIRARYDAIVAFAGLEQFMETPVKRYSSGMYARLGFSVAAHTEPDVLLVDEVLSVGDAVFRLRCLERMRSLVREGTTLVFVTHDLEQMQSICPRAIVLDRGRLVHDGSSREAVTRYLESLCHTRADRSADLPSDSRIARCEHLSFHGSTGAEIVCAACGEAIRVRARIHADAPVRRAVVELNARAASGIHLLSFNSARADREISLRCGDNEIELSMNALPLSEGQYFWNLRAWNADSGVSLIDTPFRFPLPLRGGSTATGLLALPHTWSTCYAATAHSVDARIAEVAPGSRTTLPVGSSPLTFVASPEPAEVTP